MATTTSQTVIPDWLSNLMLTSGQRGLSIANSPFTPYGGQMVAGFSPEQEQAAKLFAQRAQTTNPYLEGMLGQTRRDLQTQFAPMIAGSGSYGNTGLAETLGRAGANAENQLRYGAYQNQAQDIQNLYNVGQARQGTNQQIAQANYNEFLRGQEWPFKTQQALTGSLGLNPGSITTQTTPDPTLNRTNSIIGGGLLGAGLGSAIGGSTNIFGTPISNSLLGGGLGALLGGLF